MAMHGSLLQDCSIIIHYNLNNYTPPGSNWGHICDQCVLLGLDVILTLSQEDALTLFTTGRCGHSNTPQL